MTSVISFVLTVSVVAYSIHKKGGILESISEIAYIIPHWLFSTWIVAVGILTMPGIMDVLPSERQWIGFLSIVGLFCVASSAYYRTEARTLHNIGGWACALCAMMIVAITKPVILSGWVVFAIAMPFMGKDKWLFVSECTVYLMLIFDIFLN